MKKRDLIQILVYVIQLFIDEYEARHAAIAALEEMERQRDCAIIALRQCEASFERMYQDSVAQSIEVEETELALEIGSDVVEQLIKTVHSLQDENLRLRSSLAHLRGEQDVSEGV